MFEIQVSLDVINRKVNILMRNQNENQKLF